MQRVTRMAILVTGLFTIPAGFAVLTAGPGWTQPGGGPKITIVNRDAEPVPTKIVNSIPLEATITGPVSANLDLSSPLPTRIVGRQTVNEGGTLILEEESRFATENVMSVPLGKRLVIECASFSAGVEFGGSDLSVVNFTINAIHALAIGEVECSGNFVRSRGGHLGVIVPGGTTVNVRAYRGFSDDDRVPVRYALSGYLEDE